MQWQWRLAADAWGSALADSRNHHFIPQGYLRYFANGVGRQAKVEVFDLLARKRFPTLTRNVASRRDFNRIETEGHHPNALEDAFAQFEGEAIPALQRVVRDRRFKGEDRELVLNFIALLGIRHPARREIFGSFLQRVHKAMLHQMVRNEAVWTSIQSRAREAGYLSADQEVPYQRMSKFARDGQFDIVIHQNELIRSELENFQNILDTLADRKWHLYIAREGEADLITSDHPVCLGWTVPSQGPYGVGFGLRRTYVAFPLTRRAALWGTFEIDDEGCYEIGKEAIAELNRRVISHSFRQVYARNDNFFYRVNAELIEGSRLIQDSRFAKKSDPVSTG